MINSYFVTLFSITAMALDRLGAIVFPFAYLEFLRGSRIKKVCVGIWTVGFLIALFHNIVNSSIITSCTSSRYKEVYVSVGIRKHNIIIIGIVNLLSLILNMLLFLSLFFYLMKKNYNERDHAIPILKTVIRNFPCVHNCSFIWPSLYCDNCHGSNPRQGFWLCMVRKFFC